MASNEGKACDAVLRALERRSGKRRKDLIFPAQPFFPTDQQVELLATLGLETFALEHTYIEPFEGYRDLEHHVGPLKVWLRERLRTVLDPAASLDLGIPINELRGRQPKELKRIKENLAKWISAVAPTLTPDAGDRAHATVRRPDVDIPFEVTLRRRELLNYPTRLEVFSIVPHDTERLRRKRLRAAYWRKARKLFNLKSALAINTVLILEEDDVQGTNQYLVAEAVRRVEKGRRPERADEVYLISTVIKPWYLYPIRIRNRWVYDKDEPQSRWMEFDPTKLLDITTEGRSRPRRPAA